MRSGWQGVEARGLPLPYPNPLSSSWPGILYRVSSDILDQTVLCCGGYLCIGGRVAADLAFTHSMPVAPLSLSMTNKNVFIYRTCPLQEQNHPQLRITALINLKLMGHPGVHDRSPRSFKNNRNSTEVQKQYLVDVRGANEPRILNHPVLT